MGAIASICDRTPDRLSPLDAIMVTAVPNPEGVVLVRFFEGNSWSWVVTDDRILADRNVHRLESQPTGRRAGAPDPSRDKWALPIGVHSSEPGELWPCLVEKAWAKLHGGYGAIVDLANGSQRAQLALLPYAGSSMMRPLSHAACTDALWADLLLWSRRGWPMELASRDPTPGGGVRDKQDAEGIVGKHAYSLLRVVEAPGGVRLLQLRNPWGHGEWKGSFADSDLTHWTPALRQALGYDPAGGDDGIFWMSLQDVCRKFAHLYIVRELRLRGDGGTWHRVTARGSWRSEQSLGSSWHTTAAYAMFQQFLLLPLARGSFILVVMQDEPRLARAAADVAVMTRDASDAGSGSALSVAALNRAKRLDKAEFSVGAQQEEEITLDPASGPLTLIPIFTQALGAPTRGFTLMVLSETPFELQAIGAGGAPTSEGTQRWSEAAASGSARGPPGRPGLLAESLPAGQTPLSVESPLHSAGAVQVAQAAAGAQARAGVAPAQPSAGKAMAPALWLAGCAVAVREAVRVGCGAGARVSGAAWAAAAQTARGGRTWLVPRLAQPLTGNVVGGGSVTV